MSFAEIEAELKKLTPEQLRELALKSWSAYVEKEGLSDSANQCDEDDPVLLAALDEAVSKSDTGSVAVFSASEVRARLGKWTSK